MADASPRLGGEGWHDMHRVSDIAEFLASFAPPRLAESWDNVGLLVGGGEQQVNRIMTCLTITPASVAEAVERRADLIVTHHPLPFRPLKQLTTGTYEGRLLLQLIRAAVAVYSPHTAFDSAAEGINQRLAEGLGLNDIQVVTPSTTGDLGAGRWGTLPGPEPLAEVLDRVKTFLRIEQAQFVGSLERPVQSVAVACGSAGEFATPALALGCDCLVTGEVRFHTCLEAEASGLALVLAGHYATERFGVELLSEVLATQFSSLTCWASQAESDPLQWG